VDRAGLHRVRAAFRALFVEGEGVFAERLERVRAMAAADPFVAEMLAFVEAPSKRGLIRHTARRVEDDVE
jgi:UDP-N-acetylglucosamine acyltransferase